MDQFDFQRGMETRVGWAGDKNLTVQLRLTWY